MIKYTKYIDIERKTYVLEYWKDKGWYVGRLIEIPKVMSQGKTMKELEMNICNVYSIRKGGGRKDGGEY